MLGAKPELGREFLPEEDQPGRNNVVILSHGLWQRRFGGDPKIINQTITLSGRIYTVIGVMPATFSFGGQRQRCGRQWGLPQMTPRITADISCRPSGSSSRRRHARTGAVGNERYRQDNWPGVP